MKGKAIFLVAGAAGYVLGTRAGRERYDQIASAVGRLWGNPKVQQRVVDLEDKAGDLAKHAGAKAQGFAQEKVSAAAGSVASTVKDKLSSDQPLGEQHHTRMPND